MARRASATWIRGRVDPRELELLPFESRIAFKEIGFGFTLIEHRSDLMHTDSGAFDDRKSAADFRVGHDHTLGLLELRKPGAQFAPRGFRLEQQSAHCKIDAGLLVPPAVKFSEQLGLGRR